MLTRAQPSATARERAMDQPAGAARAARLAAARHFIERNLHRADLTPSDVAQALGISLRQLHRLFAGTGTSFSRSLLGLRLERARRQLADHPERPVIEIAVACGIDSPTVFYRGFREAYGMAPTAYRRSLRRP
jgi:AraC-like DNA-binding protein